MSNRPRFRACLISAGFFLLLLATAHAQTAVHHLTPAPAPAKPEEPADPLGRTSPRGTLLGFLLAARNGDNQTAAQYLNTSLHGQAAASLAHELFVVLDRRLPTRITQVSDRPEGSLLFPTKPDQDLIGAVESDEGNVDIVVQRVNRGKRLSGCSPVGLWAPFRLFITKWRPIRSNASCRISWLRRNSLGSLCSNGSSFRRPAAGLFAYLDGEPVARPCGWAHSS